MPQTCCHGAPGSDPGSESVNPPGLLVFPVNTNTGSIWRTKAPVSRGRATLLASTELLPAAGTVQCQRRCVTAPTHGVGCKMSWIVLDILKQEDFNRFSLSILERLERGRITRLCVRAFLLYLCGKIVLILCTLFTYLHAISLRD